MVCNRRVHADSENFAGSILAETMSGNEYRKRFSEKRELERGRPRRLDPAIEAQVRNLILLRNPPTLRTVQNKSYLGEALDALCDCPAFSSVSPKTTKRIGGFLCPHASGVCGAWTEGA